MLTKDALISALPLTEKLDSQSFFLVPVTGTPLEALVRDTRSDKNFVVGSGVGDISPDIDNIEIIANMKDPVLKFSAHDKTMDEVADVAIAAVQGHISVARNVVAPAVQELVEKTAQSLREMTPSALVGMEVCVWNPPAPLVNSALETSVRRFAEVVYDVPKLNARLPSLPVSDIVALMASGSSGLDADVKEWLAAKGESFVLKLWTEVFQQNPFELTNVQPRTFRDIIEDRECGVENALAIYLITRRLVDEVLDGVEMTLPQYTAAMVEFRNQSGLRLCRAIDEQASVLKAGLLVRSIKDKCTTVNGDVYKAWIEAGGENEILFGNLLDEPAVSTVALLNDKADKLKGLWSRHAAMTATIENNRRFARTKSILAGHFQAQLAEEARDNPAIAGNISMVTKLFDEQLETVSDSEFDNMYALCLKLVCRSRFVQTDAERILEGIERVKKENPNIDVREAAAVSIIEYVAYWVSTQFQVVDY